MKPWRLLLPRIDDPPPELDQQLFEAMLALETKRKRQKVKWGHESTWSVNQSEGQFVLHFEDDDVSVLAQPQIIGTLYEGTFMWGWHNPSVCENLALDATRVRELGEQQGLLIFSQPTFAATERDGYAMMALAAQLTNADGAYAGYEGDRVVYFTLHNLHKERTAVAEPDRYEEAPPSRGLLGKLGDRMQTSIEGFFQFVNSLISAQVAGVQVSLRELREIESLCQTGHQQVEAGDYMNAVRTFDKAWQSMGEWAVDQEPASWVQLAKGNAQFLAGDYRGAFESLNEAAQIPGCPDVSLLYRRLGQCCLASGDDARALDMFARCYVARGEQGLAELPEAEIARFMTALRDRRRQAEQRVAAEITSGEDRQVQRAVAIVKCLIADLYQFELEAQELNERAAREREDDHILCEADWQAELTNNTRFCWILATWFTPNRFPRRTRWQSPPEHDPSKEHIIRARRGEDGAIAVETEAENVFGLVRWRYELAMQNDTLLVTQVFSLLDDEEYADFP